MVSHARIFYHAVFFANHLPMSCNEKNNFKKFALSRIKILLYT